MKSTTLQNKKKLENINYEKILGKLQEKLNFASVLGPGRRHNHSETGCPGNTLLEEHNVNTSNYS